MDELLKKLLDAEILTESVKVELEQAFNVRLEEAIEQSKVAAGEQVRAELTEQWITERDALIEAVDTQVGEFLAEELTELKTDIDNFRNLEVEYAAKLVEAKADMAKMLEADMVELVEKIDMFLEIRLNSELEELKEDIQSVKKLEFGRQLFEGFVAEYRKNFVDSDGVEAELRESREQIARLSTNLKEAETKLDKQVRTAKLVELLKPLNGKERDVMESILTKLPTEQLGEGYKTFIGRVIKTSATVEETDEKEGKVLAEASSKEKPKTIKEKLELTKVAVKTGDLPGESVVTESKVVNPSVLHAQRLAGIIE